MNDAGNSVNLASSIIRLPSGWDFSVWIRDQWYSLFFSHVQTYLYDTYDASVFCLPSIPNIPSDYLGLQTLTIQILPTQDAPHEPVFQQDLSQGQDSLPDKALPIT